MIMEQNKKTVSATTVFITIAFLAMFIILPPVTRILYAEEDDLVQESIEENKEEEEAVLDTYTLVCTKEYTNVPLIISSKSTYTGREIETNEITFENANNILDANALTDPNAQKEATEFLETLNIFKDLDTEHRNTTGSTTIITLDSEFISSLSDNTVLSNHFQDKYAHQDYYEENGFTCMEE